MTSVFGNIGEYDEGAEEFSTYISRVNLFFLANNLQDDRKVPAFLSTIGPKVFGLVKDLVSPKSVEKCSYDELVDALTKHYRPQTIVIYERFKFYNRKQQDGESIASFVAGIKSCARTCEFKENLEEMCRDRLVMGLNDESTQRVMLTDKNLTFASAVELASAREAAARDGKSIANASSGASVNIVHSGSNKNYSGAKSKNFQKVKHKPGSNSNGGKFNSNPKSKPDNPCSGCGGNHWKKDCSFKEAECWKCQKKGHIGKVCFSKSKPNYNHAISSSNSKSKVSEEYIFHEEVVGQKVLPYLVDVSINDINVSMELDTGASRSIMSLSTLNSLWPDSNNRPKLQKSNLLLRTYGGSKMDVLGEIFCTVSIKTGSKGKGFLTIVNEEGPNLIGRDWIDILNIPVSDWVSQTNDINYSNHPIATIFPKLFEPGLGELKDMKVKIATDTTTSPKFCKARPVPYAIREKVDKELDRLVSEKVIEPVNHSDWAAPIVPVMKPDGSIRICGDYRLTVNKVAKVDGYPIPRIEDLFSRLAGGKIFSKLDMSQAYAQLPLEESSKDLTTINTQRGLYRYNRLCFGVSAAPSIFQRCMESLIKDIPGVVCYLDDLLVSGSTKGQHDQRLSMLLSKLQDSGLKLREDKCYFEVSEVSYLGYKIDGSGIHPTTEKLNAITNAPAPKDITQLRSYLGILNFYRKFLPNAATVLEPLNELMRAKVSWFWGPKQEKAFQDSKSMLLNSKVLIHYDPKLPIVITTDSSSYGMGAVLSQVVNGDELPVHFASRTLNASERKYSQTEKEALALVFALKRFHDYTWGRKFTLVTDHKPLLGLFSPDKPMSVMASGRVQRWALMIQAYNFTLVHKSGKTLGTADGLSRLPVDECHESAPVPAEWVHLLNILDGVPINASQIKDWTRQDAILGKVFNYTNYGWPAKVDHDLKPYFIKRNEISIQEGCLLWGARVVVPKRAYSVLLEELHKEHVGASRMKELARSYFWWPGIDSAIESLVNKCFTCLQTRQAPKKAELHPWEWPEKPWNRIHIDYAGPIKGKYFLVVIDAHSKWAEIYETSNPNSNNTISILRHIFAHLGLPVTIVSDNGTCFTSWEFRQFCTKNGIHHVKSAVYKPSTNGLAENMVKQFKNAIKTNPNEDIKTRIDKFLFKHRLTPHTTTGQSPASLMFGRRLRSTLDLIHPMANTKQRVLKKQENQKSNYSSKRPRVLDLRPRESVMIRKYPTPNNPKWVPAVVDQQTGPLSYRCQLPDGKIVKRHQDQIHERTQEEDIKLEDTKPVITNEIVRENIAVPVGVQVEAQPQVEVRRSGRTIRPPDRLNL